MPKPNTQIIIDAIIKGIEQGADLRLCYGKEIPKTGYYVYALINPLDSKMFYIGKGKGKRVLMHDKDLSQNKYKSKVILDILMAGLNYDYVIISCFDNEKDAFIIEDLLIRQFASKLTNISAAKQKEPTRWLEYVNKELLNEGKELVKKIKKEGIHLFEDYYLYKGEYYKAKLARPNIYGRLISI